MFDIAVASSIATFLKSIGDRFEAVLLDVGSLDQGTLRFVEGELTDRGLPLALLVTRNDKFQPKSLSDNALCYAHQSLEELTAALQRVAKGERLLATEPAHPAGDHRLTARQTEVLRLIARGFGAKEIATALGVSVRTAEFHRAAVMHRLGLHNSADLTRFAMQAGLAF